MNLLIDTIPLLCKAKKDVLLFFRGAGVSAALTDDMAARLKHDSAAVNKYEMVRTILSRLNAKGDAAIRERREVVKRVVEFEDFSSCWPADQLKAKGLVAQIRHVVNVKDSFTRMNQEREAERNQRLAEQRAQAKKEQEHKAELSAIRSDLFALFGEQNPQKRGKALEGVLNRLFEVNGILISESFCLVEDQGEGVSEQIDGVVEIDGSLYFVEMKWWNKPLGRAEVSEHLVRLFHREEARGIFISASGYTAPAVAVCKEALQQKVVVLCKLEEIVRLLEQEGDLKGFLKEKVNAAIVHHNLLYEPLGEGVV